VWSALHLALDFGVLGPRLSGRQDAGGELRLAPTASNKLRAIPPAVAPGPLALAPEPVELSPRAFEERISELLCALGYRATMTRPTADGGIDIEAVDLRPLVGGKMIVQCKRYRGNVGVVAVRELYGVVNHEHAAKGALVTTGDFTSDARAFAAGKPLELINGAQLKIQLGAHVDAESEARPVDAPALSRRATWVPKTALSEFALCRTFYMRNSVDMRKCGVCGEQDWRSA
jgi:hypothetical protein